MKCCYRQSQDTIFDILNSDKIPEPLSRKGTKSSIIFSSKICALAVEFMLPIVIQDHLGNKLELTTPPQRIISLVPSQTELLFDLGLENRVMGITKFCVHPPHWLKSKAIVGGTKNFHYNVIDNIQPDLIIGNKEENYFEGISALQMKYPVWMSDITTLDDALSMIDSISGMTCTESKGVEIVDRIRTAFSELKAQTPAKVLYLMWRNPWMGAAGKTFIHDMIERIGWINVLQDGDRYPELSAVMFKDLDPDLILLSSEPYPFSEKHLAEIRKLAPRAQIKLVDGEMFSWYGSRLALAPAYFRSIGHQS